MKDYTFEFREEITKTCNVRADNFEEAFQLFMTGQFENEIEVAWQCIDHQCIDVVDDEEEE
tara:strand:- start:1663 stop:1845 length:183 start_codon:yes stop_codon:yes gene_type:complete